MSEWQPLPAPEGCDVDLLVEYPRLGARERITDCRWTGSRWIMRDDERGWKRLSADSNPTHWMPLPAPPARLEGEEA